MQKRWTGSAQDALRQPERLAETWHYADLLSLMQQIGAIPAGGCAAGED
jgi:hypothetical protein